MLIAEGVATWSNERIVYPSITSCMTITCIFPGPVFVGGHCVLVPRGNQLTRVGIANRILDLSQNRGARQHIFFVGARGVWTMADLGPLWHILDAGAQTEIDTYNFGSVDVEFLPTGFVNVVDRDSRQIVHQQRFDP